MSAPWPCTCGDGTLDPGEQCDDGNKTDGDGCSAGCQLESAAVPTLAQYGLLVLAMLLMGSGVAMIHART
jgi:cysteine-rich repeat protein